MKDHSSNYPGVPMQVLESKTGEVLTVVLKGRLDAASSSAAQDQILGLIERGERRIVVNLAGLDYVSSAGLRIFMTAAKRLNACQGKMVFCSVQEYTRELFEIAGFTSLFQSFPDEQTAVQALRNQQQ